MGHISWYDYLSGHGSLDNIVSITPLNFALDSYNVHKLNMNSMNKAMCNTKLKDVTSTTIVRFIESTECTR